MLQDTFKHNENVQVNSREMEALKEHFPQCFDANGNFDMTVFEELIKAKDVSIKKEGYALNFLGKSYARYLANLESETVIVPDAGNKDNPSNNIYIVGDNLDALQHLKHSYAGAIKCIYIDPPYNTGSDGFVYNDKFEFTASDLAEKIGIEEDEAERILNMQGKSTHSAWLTFMYPRLELAKELLSNDGVIFISIDDNEQANCRLLCDSIFGEGNFEGNIHYRRRANQPNDKTKLIGLVAEHILVYSKNSKFLKESGVGKIALTGEFSNPDNDPRGDWATKPWKTGSDQSGTKYEITTPTGKVLFEEWMGEEKTYLELLADNRIIFPKNGDGMPRKKYFKSERAVEGQCACNWWVPETCGDNASANTELAELFDAKNIFSNPKHTKLLETIISLSNCKNDDIILDFFSGSATTAHAAMLNNVAGGDKIKYIMVQLNEPVKKGGEAEKAGYKTIDEIGRERIRRAAAKLKEDEPEKSKGVDLGFKTYYLKAPEKQTLDKMERFNPEFPIDGNDMLAAFGKETVLATWAIKDGYGFNIPIKEIDLKGYTAYFINDGIHGANLYLLNEILEHSIMELVRILEANELIVDKIIVFGYALSFTASTSLRTNLKTLKNRNPIDITIRY